MGNAQNTSDFYWACRNGDVDTVKKMLPKLKANDINRIESNGSTALHAASYYGHANIVRLLLERGANTTIRNKYEKTAKEEASTDEVRAVFESTVRLQISDDEDDDIPQSEYVQLYRNEDNIDKSELATRILRARLGTYNAHKYTISASSNLEHLEKKYYKICKEQNQEHLLKTGERCFKEYRETGNFDYMLTLYTKETPFYRMMLGDETFIVEMYKHLLTYTTRNFQGYTYRGAGLLSKELEPYKWAMTHPNSLLELRYKASTSKDRHIAIHFIPYMKAEYKRVLFEFHFPERCFTAIDIEPLSEYPDEKEVFVVSGSFFKVTHISELDNRWGKICLENVPVDKKAVSAMIRQLSKVH